MCQSICYLSHHRKQYVEYNVANWRVSCSHFLDVNTLLVTLAVTVIWNYSYCTINVIIDVRRQSQVYILCC